MISAIFSLFIKDRFIPIFGFPDCDVNFILFILFFSFLHYTNYNSHLHTLFVINIIFIPYPSTPNNEQSTRSPLVLGDDPLILMETDPLAIHKPVSASSPNDWQAVKITNGNSAKTTQVHITQASSSAENYWLSASVTIAKLLTSSLKPLLLFRKIQNLHRFPTPVFKAFVRLRILRMR